MNVSFDDVVEAWKRARSQLLDERIPQGHWVGELSSSALSTATAVCALRDFLLAPVEVNGDRTEIERNCEQGRQWLIAHQNSDGGWGDTVFSFSNVSTTALCWAALAAGGPAYAGSVQQCEQWLRDRAGSLDPATIAESIRKRYGSDHTFSVPILVALALSGRLGPEAEAWERIPQLPFELAACPHAWYAALRLPVVSYALPALIAIGLVQHHRGSKANGLLRWLRNRVERRVLRRLRKIQPTSGGFLEATPLTSFVMMSLIGAGKADSTVVAACVRFLIRSARSDGSWPIDTNLSVWVSTLAIRALHQANTESESLGRRQAAEFCRWLIEQQYREVHPYTRAAPGGWAWTDLTGGVPDADDTPGALLALKYLDDGSPQIREAVEAGTNWLVNLQNRDGGIPTFCRGWGTLPFDRSSPDLTAHVLRAWWAWQARLPIPLQHRVNRARRRALNYLLAQQHPNGAWTPLWFGNQHAGDESNPTYGTSRVLVALLEQTGADPCPAAGAVERGFQWLLRGQNEDGGWGGGPGCPSSVEETALALEPLVLWALSDMDAGCWRGTADATQHTLSKSIGRAASFLLQATQGGTTFPVSPIGLYFANLWYFERLYPLVFSVNALGPMTQFLARQQAFAGKEAVH